MSSAVATLSSAAYSTLMVAIATSAVSNLAHVTTYVDSADVAAAAAATDVAYPRRYGRGFSHCCHCHRAAAAAAAIPLRHRPPRRRPAPPPAAVGLKRRLKVRLEPRPAGGEVGAGHSDRVDQADRRGGGLTCHRGGGGVRPDVSQRRGRAGRKAPSLCPPAARRLPTTSTPNPPHTCPRTTRYSSRCSAVVVAERQSARSAGLIRCHSASHAPQARNACLWYEQ